MKSLLRWMRRNSQDKTEEFDRGFNWALFLVLLVGVVCVAVKHLSGF